MRAPDRFLLLSCLMAVHATIPIHEAIAQSVAPSLPADFGLNDRSPIRIGEKAALVEVCVGKDGSVTKVAMVKGTGDTTFDKKIVEELRKARHVTPPPPDMPPCFTLEGQADSACGQAAQRSRTVAMIASHGIPEIHYIDRTSEQRSS